MYRSQCPWITGLMGADGALGGGEGWPREEWVGRQRGSVLCSTRNFWCASVPHFLSCQGQEIFCLLKVVLEKINALKVVRCVIISNS